MPGFKELRNRIESVKSTNKITSAMKLVAASRLRRAQALLSKSEFYSRNIVSSANRLLYQMKQDEFSGISYIYPDLMVERANPKTYLILVFTSDRGLCGNFNSAVAKFAMTRIEELQSLGKEVKVICVGKKGRDIIKRKHPSVIIETIENMAKKGAKYYEGVDLSEKIVAMYRAQEIDVCEIASSKFVSAITRISGCAPVLPIKVEEYPYNKIHAPTNIVRGAFYEYEPNKLELLTNLMPLLFRATMFQVIVHSQACEHGARMTAMDNATRNAQDVLSNLTLKYNLMRQNAITTELIEIISGAEAL